VRALAVETSCDESALALVELASDGRLHILFESLYSQEQVHNAFGGVVPEIASREHLEALPRLLDKYFASGFTLADTDLIAVTCGPGLKGCLLVGMSFALGLARSSGKLLRAAHHIEGHLLSGFLNQQSALQFPFLGLIVSGGHTELVLANAVGDYQILARTLDDAAGEAFDKSAKLLGLPYPGGRHLSQLAATAESTDRVFSSVMAGNKDFSFSGLKTAISRAVQQAAPAEYAKIALAAERAIVATLIEKLQIALTASGMKRLVICGGVAANSSLRKAAEAIPGISLCVPSFVHCTDNAAMIAASVLLREQAGLAFAQSEYSVRSRWPLEEISHG
jgi:N6-L-threonylcarbamoyladenine synthase